MSLTVKQLIERLSAARNQDAVVCLSVPDFEYAPISSTYDETLPAPGYGIFCLNLDEDTDIFRIVSGY